MLDVTKNLRARDAMTSPVVSVAPADMARRAAGLLLAHGVGGLPVVDAEGRPIGMVSESDFAFGDAGHAFGDAARAQRAETWKSILSGGQELSADYMAELDRALGEVGRFMTTPVVSVDEDTPLDEAMRLMAERKLRRLVVTRGGRIAGVIARRDLVRIRAGSPETAAEPSPPLPAEGGLTAPPGKARPAPATPAPPSGGDVTAKAFRALVAAFERGQDDLHRHAAEERRRRRDAEVAEMLAAPLSEAEWRGLIAQARARAAEGGTFCPLLRFPAALCEDGGRAINAPDPAWPATLRGKAARVYLRWREELRPQGFRLAAQIVSFPEGLPGEVELTLVWGA
jgi:CBS domain-containing protein